MEKNKEKICLKKTKKKRNNTKKTNIIICLKKTHKKKEYQKSNIKICLKKTNKNIKMHEKIQEKLIHQYVEENKRSYLWLRKC